jgi:plastocyanin
MRKLALLALALGLAVVPSGHDDSAPATAGAPATTDAIAASDSRSATITIEDFDFGDPIAVAVGDAVTVINRDGAPHTWTADDGSFDSGTISGGDSFEFVFDTAGEFGFRCAIHPSMTGTITVTG